MPRPMVPAPATAATRSLRETSSMGGESGYSSGRRGGYNRRPGGGAWAQSGGARSLGCHQRFYVPHRHHRVHLRRGGESRVPVQVFRRSARLRKSQPRKAFLRHAGHGHFTAPSDGGGRDEDRRPVPSCAVQGERGLHAGPAGRSRPGAVGFDRLGPFRGRRHAQAARHVRREAHAMERAHREGARLRHRFVFAVRPGGPERHGCAGREGAARRLQEDARRSGAPEAAAAARPGLLVQVEQGIRAMGSADAAGRARNHRAGWIAREIGGAMKYRKILLAYNGSHEGKRALLECGDLAGFLNAETHLLAVASMPPSLFLTEGFVPEELLEEEKKRTQTVLDEGIRTLRDRGDNATGHLAVGEPAEAICRLAKSLGADLIVVGHNQNTSFAARWWKGSVGASLLDYSPCSILIALSKM